MIIAYLPLSYQSITGVKGSIFEKPFMLCLMTVLIGFIDFAVPLCLLNPRSIGIGIMSSVQNLQTRKSSQNAAVKFKDAQNP